MAERAGIAGAFTERPRCAICGDPTINDTVWDTVYNPFVDGGRMDQTYAVCGRCDAAADGNASLLWVLAHVAQSAEREVIYHVGRYRHKPSR